MKDSQPIDNNNQPNQNSSIISSYTIRDAEADGIFISVNDFQPNLEDKSLFSHISYNPLTNHNYLIEDDSFNVPNLLDLLNQSLFIMKLHTNNFS